MILIVPIVIVAVVRACVCTSRCAARTDDPDAAVEAPRRGPGRRSSEAARTLLAVQDAEAAVLACIFLGAGLVPLAYPAAALPRARSSGVGELGRGVIGAANAAATFVGIALGRCADAGGGSPRAWASR